LHATSPSDDDAIYVLGGVLPSGAGVMQSVADSWVLGGGGKGGGDEWSRIRDGPTQATMAPSHTPLYAGRFIILVGGVFDVGAPIVTQCAGCTQPVVVRNCTIATACGVVSCAATQPCYGSACEEAGSMYNDVLVHGARFSTEISLA
jgi:hypothetical protein